EDRGHRRDDDRAPKCQVRRAVSGAVLQLSARVANLGEKIAQKRYRGSRCQFIAYIPSDRDDYIHINGKAVRLVLPTVGFHSLHAAMSEPHHASAPPPSKGGTSAVLPTRRRNRATRSPVVAPAAAPEGDSARSLRAEARAPRW